MVVTITYIRLRHWWQFFPLTWNALHIVRQTAKSNGFLKMKNTGFGYHHYTLSAWASAEDAQTFARTGAHLEAMRKSAALATAIGTYTYEAKALPSWAEAKKLVAASGKMLYF